MGPPRSCSTCSGRSLAPAQSVSAEARLRFQPFGIQMPWRLLKHRLKFTSYPNMTASGETYFRFGSVCESGPSVPQLCTTGTSNSPRQRTTDNSPAVYCWVDIINCPLRGRGAGHVVVQSYVPPVNH